MRPQRFRRSNGFRPKWGADTAQFRQSSLPGQERDNGDLGLDVIRQGLERGASNRDLQNLGRTDGTAAGESELRSRLESFESFFGPQKDMGMSSASGEALDNARSEDVLREKEALANRMKRERDAEAILSPQGSAFGSGGLAGAINALGSGAPTPLPPQESAQPLPRPSAPPPQPGLTPEEEPGLSRGGIVTGGGGLSAQARHAARRKDRIPVRLSMDEAVLPAKTVDALGGPGSLARLIRATNDGKPPRRIDAGGKYARGGIPSHVLWQAAENAKLGGAPLPANVGNAAAAQEAVIQPERTLSANAGKVPAAPAPKTALTVWRPQATQLVPIPQAAPEAAARPATKASGGLREALRAPIRDAGEAIRGAYQNTLKTSPSLQKFDKYTRPIIQETQKTVSPALQKVRETSGRVLQKSKETAPKAWDKVRETAKPILKKTGETSSQTLQKAKEAAPSAWQKVRETSAQAFQNTKASAPQIWQKAKEGAPQAFQKAKEAAGGLREKVAGLRGGAKAAPRALIGPEMSLLSKINRRPFRTLAQSVEAHPGRVAKGLAGLSAALNVKDYADSGELTSDLPLVSLSKPSKVAYGARAALNAMTFGVPDLIAKKLTGLDDAEAKVEAALAPVPVSGGGAARPAPGGLRGQVASGLNAEARSRGFGGADDFARDMGFDDAGAILSAAANSGLDRRAEFATNGKDATEYDLPADFGGGVITGGRRGKGLGTLVVGPSSESARIAARAKAEGWGKDAYGNWMTPEREAQTRELAAIDAAKYGDMTGLARLAARSGGAQGMSAGDQLKLAELVMRGNELQGKRQDAQADRAFRATDARDKGSREILENLARDAEGKLDGEAYQRLIRNAPARGEGDSDTAYAQGAANAVAASKAFEDESNSWLNLYPGGDKFNWGDREMLSLVGASLDSGSRRVRFPNGSALSLDRVLGMPPEYLSAFARQNPEVWRQIARLRQIDAMRE